MADKPEETTEETPAEGTVVLGVGQSDPEMEAKMAAAALEGSDETTEEKEEKEPSTKSTSKGSSSSR